MNYFFLKKLDFCSFSASLYAFSSLLNLTYYKINNNIRGVSYKNAVEFLSKYKTSSAIISEMLAYMMNNDLDIDETAEWFLKEKQDIWKTWVPADKFELILST